MKGLTWTVRDKTNGGGASPQKPEQQPAGESVNVICGLRLTDDLLRKIDKFCDEHDVSRSHVFRRGAKLYIQEKVNA
jgi:hypothetical protein